jgi:hypothetical protein
MSLAVGIVELLLSVVAARAGAPEPAVAPAPRQAIAPRCVVRLMDAATGIPSTRQRTSMIGVVYEKGRFRDVDGHPFAEKDLPTLVKSLVIDGIAEFVLVVESPSGLTTKELFNLQELCVKGLRKGEELHLVVALRNVK